MGASLVRGTEDVVEQTTGQKVVKDTTAFDVRLVDTASNLAARALSLGLLNGGGTTSVRLSSDTSDDGREGEDTREMHFESGLERRLKNLTEKLFGRSGRENGNEPRRNGFLLDG